ncbi:MAG: MFS transporter [Candidatus Saccharibacteria bacterium]|nr:MFS transporter [Candidatus Saccharibacteria bacterium]
MLRKYIHKILKKQHYWRTMNFDELSEVYVNMLLRGISIGMAGIFVPIYLVKLDFTVTQILMVYAFYFSARVGLDFVAAHSVARYGPKHTLIVGQVFQALSTLLFLTLPQFHWPVWLLGMIWGCAASFFFIAFDVDFSKIKHKKHGGKELGYEQIMEKIGAVIGPLLGGLVATVFGAQYIFLISLILMFAGGWFLLRTKEPTRLRQTLSYRDFPVHTIFRSNILPAIGLNLENTLCIVLWPLYLGLFVVTDGSVFAKVGILASVSVAMSLIGTYAIGSLIDKRYGRKLLRAGASGNAVLHFVRPFISTYPVAMGASLINEVITVGYRMPFVKGFYDTADDFPGHRIVYISIVQGMSSFAKATMWWLLVIVSGGIGAHTTLTTGFIVAGLASLLIMTEKFKALDANIR